ncbi:alpha/beta fold hydrolase [Nocardiopsis synnemataformans]|uniref:thioesterase domain-containing protein n=1 Tax=Nocardiopsis synnemataformans TaxID=61305 RepID=UPI003EBBEA49
MINQSDNLVPLRGGGEPATVFLHPASGLSTAFRRLLPHLPGTGAVYAYESLEPGGPELCSINALAEHYWAQLRGEGHEQLVLVGWSFGGPVAVAMASLAEAEGHTVLGTVAIDSGTPELLSSRDESLLGKLAGLFELDPSSFPDHESTRTVDTALAAITARLRVDRGMDTLEVDDLRPFVDTYFWHLDAAREGWDAKCPQAPFLLMRGRDEHGWKDSPEDLGWSAVLGTPPATVWLPGTHYSLMSADNVPSLAGALAPLIDPRGEAGPPTDEPSSKGESA